MIFHEKDFFSKNVHFHKGLDPARCKDLLKMKRGSREEKIDTTKETWVQNNQ